MSLDREAASVERRGHGLLDLADWAVGQLRGKADYVQAFAESTLEIRTECADGQRLATCMEPRDGLGCVVRKDGVWRYRRWSPSTSEDLFSWLTDGDLVAGQPAHWPVPTGTSDFTPLQPEEWLVPGGDVWSIRTKEDYVARAIAVVDTEGVRASSVTRSVRQRVEATVAADGHKYRGLSRWLRRGFARHPHPGGSYVTSVALSHARDTACGSQGGKHRTPVVFGPSAGAGFLHELIGHALEGDNFVMGSDYITRLRKPGAIPASLSLRDDPTIEHGHGSYEIDDEGRPARVTTLVERGEIGRPLTSVRVVHRSGYTPTGNGRRRTYRELAIPRASNTVAMPGTDDHRSFWDATGTGVLYVGCLGAGMINLVTGEFSFAALNCAYITPAGERVPVRDVSLVGDALDALSRLEGIGSDLDGDNITCGKQGQMVGIGIYSPSMRYASLDWSAA
jgi:PmbA/TldA metallopeptidase C-terminal domain